MRRTARLLSLGARLRRAATAPLPLLGLVAAVGPLALTSGSEPVANQAEVAYRSLPALPDGSTDHTADGLAHTAIALAASLHAVPLDALGAECPVDDLIVSWVEPGDRYSFGAHVTPIGPEPDSTTEAVNGIVACRGSDYAYMGFEALWVDDRWDVVDVPYVGHEEDEHQLVPQPAPAIPQGPKPVPVLAAPGTVTGPIEGYAAYEPQRTCDPTAKVGTKSLAGALLRDYAGSRNLGIVRGCAVGGRSEHKEGRAFDWGVNITNPNEKAAAQAFIGALMATDAAGNKHALARRMGVMYLIFDRQIWSAYRASEGWRPYSGSSPHRDHVHLSLSWAGALGRTSFWSGTVPPDLPVASPVTANVASRRGTGEIVATSESGRHRGTWTPRGDDDQPSPVRLSRDQLSAGVRALWHDGQPPTAAEIQAWLVGQGVSSEWAAQYASWAAERAARLAAREQSRSDARDEDEAAPTRDHDDDGERDWAAEREAREAAAREARDQAEEEWERRRDERREAEREAREAREAAEAEREEAWRAERERRRLAREEWERERREARQTTTTVAPTTTTVGPTTTLAPTTTIAATNPTTVAPTSTTLAAPVPPTAAPTPIAGSEARPRGRGNGGGGRRGR